MLWFVVGPRPHFNIRSGCGRTAQAIRMMVFWCLYMMVGVVASKASFVARITRDKLNTFNVFIHSVANIFVGCSKIFCNFLYGKITEFVSLSTFSSHCLFLRLPWGALLLMLFPWESLQVFQKVPSRLGRRVFPWLLGCTVPPRCRRPSALW